MEKMLDKKSRDFAKNMRDTMIYDDMANEVQVGTDLYVDGNFTANSIIENMRGYKFFSEELDNEHRTLTYSYAGVVKTGNKITFAIAGTIVTKDTNNSTAFGRFSVPKSISDKLYPTTIGEISNILDIKSITLSATGYSIKQLPVTTYKSYGGTSIEQSMYNLSELTIGTIYHFRSEITFLLSDNLAVK